jgi:hypothetical protein
MDLMIIDPKNDPTSVFDRHFSIKCPHCTIQSNVSAISIPRYDYLLRFRPKRVGIAYCCDSCKEPVFLRFKVEQYDPGNNRIQIDPVYEEIERPQETFEFKYLPEEVEKDFREALICFSNICFNAFGAMCRRSIQSASTVLGAEGKDKVLRQIQDLKHMAAIDDETFEILKQVTVAGHDGAHPHLPNLSAQRANILLELMKDVLYQLFVRRAKIKEAMDLRKDEINKSNLHTEKGT